MLYSVCFRHIYTIKYQGCLSFYSWVSSCVKGLNGDPELLRSRSHGPRIHRKQGGSRTHTCSHPVALPATLLCCPHYLILNNFGTSSRAPPSVFACINLSLRARPRSALPSSRSLTAAPTVHLVLMPYCIRYTKRPSPLWYIYFTSTVYNDPSQIIYIYYF